MAWTDKKVRLLRILWKSNWTQAAIGVALDMPLTAVGRKIRRLRIIEDVDILMGDLGRSVMEAMGVAKIDATQARALLDMPGYVQGLLDDDAGKDAA